MDNVRRLCDKAAQIINSGDKVVLGKASGTAVVVGGRSYAAEYAAEMTVYEGKWVRCVVSNGRAVVIGE